MTVQTILVLLLTLGALAYFGRGFILGLLGGGCGTEGGCAKCAKGGCTLTKLEALKQELEARKS